MQVVMALKQNRTIRGIRSDVDVRIRADRALARFGPIARWYMYRARNLCAEKFKALCVYLGPLDQTRRHRVIRSHLAILLNARRCSPAMLSWRFLTADIESERRSGSRAWASEYQKI